MIKQANKKMFKKDTIFNYEKLATAVALGRKSGQTE